MTAAEAPPCLAPESAPAAAAKVVKTSTPEEDMCLTIAVEQLLSCSAWTIHNVYTALRIIFLSSGLSSPFGGPNIHKQFYTYLRFDFGWMGCSPRKCLYILATRVGTTPRRICILMFRITGLR